MSLKNVDPEIAGFISQEEDRIRRQLQMIPSENYVSEAVLEAVGSVVINKYSEGAVGKRYYQGNSNIDGIEGLAKSRAIEAFGLDRKDWGIEVQAVTGAIANTAIYAGLIEPGDRMLGMYLYDGGHLSHGWKMSDKKRTTFNSRIYESAFYHVDPKTEVFDYDEIQKIAEDFKPRILISGGTAYPREIDHKRLGEIAHSIGAYYLADVSHEAGLVLAGVNASPFEHADVVMMTTRKTLRGPNGALIFSRKKLTRRIRKAVFPGMQGGPLNDHIAGIAVALKEAMQPEFEEYAQQIVKNAQMLANELSDKGYRLISGGTDKHLVLLDASSVGISGKEGAIALEKANIIVNMNTIPNDPSKPTDPSGIRMGTPSLTSRGMNEDDMKKIADWIDKVLKDPSNDELLSEIGKEVEEFALKFPIRADQK